MTWVRIENNEIVQIVEQPDSSMAVWVEEPVYEMVEVFEQLDDSGEVVSVGFLQEETGKTHNVQTSVSLPTNWEVDFEQMKVWGWTEVEESGFVEGGVPGDIELVNSKPVRIWEEPPAPGMSPDIPPPTLDEIASGQVADPRVALAVIARELQQSQG